MTAAEDRTDGPDPSRRTLIRGVAAVGLAGAAGIPLAGCGSGGDDAQAAGAAPAAEPVEPVPTTKPRPTGKSEVYKRTPEPRGKRSPAPDAAPEVASEPAPAGSPQAPAGEPSAKPAGKADELATARQKGGKPEKGRPVKTADPATPGPLPAGALARTSDIPVGGGKAFEAEKIVVTQPTKGTFKGFSAKCTHTGCFLDTVEGGVIVCPCHGSRFAVTDGAVQKGPAMTPLPAEKISVSTDGVITKG